VRQPVGCALSKLISVDQARHEFARGYLSQVPRIASGHVSQAAHPAKCNFTDFYKLTARCQLVPDDFEWR
jgi:hypothetical protein